MIDSPVIPLVIGGLVFYLAKKYSVSTPVAVTASVGGFIASAVILDNYLDAKHARRLSR